MDWVFIRCGFFAWYRGNEKAPWLGCFGERKTGLKPATPSLEG